MNNNCKQIIPKEDEVYFAGSHPSVKIPTKRDEDAGYDIFANFKEDFMYIRPHETKMIPTGLASAFNKKWYIQLVERGSTGSKGMGQRCGVIDSGYRGEWFIPITNHNNHTIIIAKEGVSIPKFIKQDAIIYPYEKAICQAVLIEVPKVKLKTISIDELKSIPSERREGMLGSSNK